MTTRPVATAAVTLPTMSRTDAAPQPPSFPRRRMLRDSVYDALHDMLVSGSLAAGEPLAIETLALQLDVSPTPVREALVQLESTAMVTRTALRGYRVAPLLQGDELAQLFDARLLLEVGAAERAAEHVDGLLPALRELVDRHEAAAERVRAAAGGDSEDLRRQLRDYFAVDWGFHDAILRATGNRFIVDMSTRMSTHAQRMRHLVAHQHIDVDEAVAEHRTILAAFESGDRTVVVSAVRAHIEAVRRRAERDLEEALPSQA